MPAWLEATLTVLIGLTMLVGWIGLVIPIFPGLLVMWLPALGYGIMNGFDALGIVLFVLISLLALLGSFADNLLMAAGGRKGGAAWGTIILALMAGVLGTLLLPPFGGVIVAPLAVMLLEYYRVRDWQKAWQALRGLVTGYGLSFVARFLIGFVILLLWGFWVLQAG